MNQHYLDGALLEVGHPFVVDVAAVAVSNRFARRERHAARLLVTAAAPVLMLTRLAAESL